MRIYQVKINIFGVVYSIDVTKKSTIKDLLDFAYDKLNRMSGFQIVYNGKAQNQNTKIDNCEGCEWTPDTKVGRFFSVVKIS